MRLFEMWNKTCEGIYLSRFSSQKGRKEEGKYPREYSFALPRRFDFGVTP